jgi:hypothetical protein
MGALVIAAAAAAAAAPLFCSNLGRLATGAAAAAAGGADGIISDLNCEGKDGCVCRCDCDGNFVSVSNTVTHTKRRTAGSFVCSFVRFQRQSLGVSPIDSIRPYWAWNVSVMCRY